CLPNQRNHQWMSGIPRIDKTTGLALLARAKMQHRENVLLKSVETHALEIGHRNCLRVAVALAAATAWIGLAGNSAHAAVRGVGFPYGWYDGWYAPPAPMLARRGLRPRDEERPRRISRQALATCRKVRCRSSSPSTIRK